MMNEKEERKVFETMQTALWNKKWDEIKKMFETYGVTFFSERKELRFEMIQRGVLGHIIAGKQIDLVRILIENGWDVHEKDYAGDSALYDSIVHGNKEILLYLLDKGLQVNHKNKQGQTGMMLAITYGEFEKAKLLYQYGGDINIWDNTRKTPLQYMYFEEEQEKDFVNFLLEQPERLHEENLKLLKEKRLEFLYK